MNLDWPLGVDVVEFKKAGRLYRSHKNRLGSFLSTPEISYVKKSARPEESLALLLAAKEAVFKSLPLSWMGPAGFGKIQILPKKNKKFSFRLKGDLKKVSPRRPLELSYVKTADCVVMQCRPKRIG